MSPILARIFGIDPRSLAAFRIGLGLLLLVDLGIRATALTAHYSDDGVLPIESMQATIQGTWKWSLHAWHGSASYQALLFVIAATAALALVLGIHSRVACLISWVLLLSMQTRNPVVNNGGDILLKCLVFWSIFLPLGQCWSIDRQRRGAGSCRVVLSLASAAIMMQVALMYFMAGCYKYDGGWHSSDVLLRILRSDCYARPLAYWITQFPDVLGILGRISLWSELVIPWLIFLPVYTKPIRLLAIAWFWMFHLGIELTLTVGLFSYVCCLAWILFLPDVFWNCPLWNRGRNQESHLSQATQDIETNDRRQTSADFMNRLLVGPTLLMVVIWNLANLPATRPYVGWPDELQGVIEWTGLQQRWNMFRSPMRDDGWYVVAARLRDGQVVDLLRDGAPADWDSYTKPKWIYRRFPNHRWRKYYRNLTRDRWATLRPHLCAYLARQWSKQYPDRPEIISIELHYMQEIGEQPDEPGDGDDGNRFQQRFLCTWPDAEGFGEMLPLETE